MDSGCPERRDVARTLAGLWRPAPLDLVELVTDFAYEPEVRLSSLLNLSWSHRHLSGCDDRPWTHILEVCDDNDDESNVQCVLRLLRGAESIALRLPGHAARHRIDRIRVTRHYVFVSAERAHHVCRREDGVVLRSWAGTNQIHVGDELYLEVDRTCAKLCQLATGDILDAWASPDHFCGRSAAIEANDASAWIPDTLRIPGGMIASPGFRVPIVNGRFVRDRVFAPTRRPIGIDSAHLTCLRGSWIYFLTYHTLAGVHENGTRFSHSFQGKLGKFIAYDIVSTPRYVFLVFRGIDSYAEKWEAFRMSSVVGEGWGASDVVAHKRKQ